VVIIWLSCGGVQELGYQIPATVSSDTFSCSVSKLALNCFGATDTYRAIGVCCASGVFPSVTIGAFKLDEIFQYWKKKQ
ncbi:hypothetical protein HK405_008554, partial [Cladochytrium tenue]